MTFKGCPGSKMMDFSKPQAAVEPVAPGSTPSQLRQWPVQLHLISPMAPYFQGADVVLTADCVAYALGGYHTEHLQGKAIAIACPKLDSHQEVYVDKIRAWFDDANINTLTVMIMEVPCCRGLSAVARQALESATRKVPVKEIIVGIDGTIRQSEWLTL